MLRLGFVSGLDALPVFSPGRLLGKTGQPLRTARGFHQFWWKPPKICVAVLGDAQLQTAVSHSSPQLFQRFTWHGSTPIRLYFKLKVIESQGTDWLRAYRRTVRRPLFSGWLTSYGQDP